MKAGKSLNEIAQAQKVSTSDLHTTVLNAVNSDVNKAVSAGDLTQTQGTDFSQFLKNHPNYVDHILNREFGKNAQKQ